VHAEIASASQRVQFQTRVRSRFPQPHVDAINTTLQSSAARGSGEGCSDMVLKLTKDEGRRA